MSSESIGSSIGSFIGAGLLTAIIAAIINWALAKYAKSLNRTVRLLISCFTVPVFSLFVYLDGAIFYFLAGVVVFLAFLLSKPKTQNPIAPKQD